jgi:hypothetical protein
MSFDEAMLEHGRALLMGYMEAAKWCVSKAAAAAGRNRTAFYQLLAQHGIARSWDIQARRKQRRSSRDARLRAKPCKDRAPIRP